MRPDLPGGYVEFVPVWLATPLGPEAETITLGLLRVQSGWLSAPAASVSRARRSSRLPRWYSG
ncbi:MAG: hypothetical protein ACRDND_30190, partial [Streptosporangiaceae bacterium]